MHVEPKMLEETKKSIETLFLDSRGNPKLVVSVAEYERVGEMPGAKRFFILHGDGFCKPSSINEVTGLEVWGIYGKGIAVYNYDKLHGTLNHVLNIVSRK